MHQWQSASDIICQAVTVTKSFDIIFQLDKIWVQVNTADCTFRTINKHLIYESFLSYKES